MVGVALVVGVVGSIGADMSLICRYEMDRTDLESLG